MMRLPIAGASLAALALAGGAFALPGTAAWAGSSATITQSGSGNGTSATTRTTSDGGQTITRRSGNSSATISQSPSGRATIEQNGKGDTFGTSATGRTTPKADAALGDDCAKPSVGGASSTTPPTTSKPSSKGTGASAGTKPGTAGTSAAAKPAAGAKTTGAAASTTGRAAGKGVDCAQTTAEEVAAPATPPRPSTKGGRVKDGPKTTGSTTSAKGSVGQKVKDKFGFDIDASSTFQKEFLNKAK